MKRIAIVLAGAALLCTISCNKERTCRCAVRGNQTVRIVTVKNEKCEDIRFIRYNASILDLNQVDSVVCSDYEFSIDSTFNE